MLNPQSAPQAVSVTVLGTRNVTRTVTLGARTREALDLGSWGVSGGFGVEVKCDGPCAASLVMWDPGFTSANVSVPIVGCESR